VTAFHFAMCCVIFNQLVLGALIETQSGGLA
jgi:hypothetical protein